MSFTQADGPIKLTDLGKPIFIYMPSEWWKDESNRKEVAPHFALLIKALDDPSPSVQLPAAVQLFFLKNTEVDPKVLTILKGAGVDLGSKSKASQNARAQKKALRALETATLSSNEKIPPAFVGMDWNTAYRKGKTAAGKKLFTARGCIACHLAPDDGKGGQHRSFTCRCAYALLSPIPSRVDPPPESFCFAQFPSHHAHHEG